MGLEDFAYHLIETGSAFKQFLALAEALKHDQHGPTFLMGLGLAYDFSKNSAFAQEMMFVGGYGVLGHMVGQEGLDVVRRWRGSHDLDIVCASLPAAQFLQTNSAVEDRVPLHLPSKKTFELQDAYLPELCGKEGLVCKADVYLPLRQPNDIRIGKTHFSPSDVSAATEIPVFGVPFRVARLSDALRMKLDVTTGDNVPRGKDIIDLFNLLGVAERREISPGAILGQLSFEQSTYLLEALKHGSEYQKHEHALTTPTVKYLREMYEAYKDLYRLAPSLEFRMF